MLEAELRFQSDEEEVVGEFIPHNTEQMGFCSTNKKESVWEFFFLLLKHRPPSVSVPSQAAVSMLKQDFKEGEMTLSTALALAIKVLNKTMDVSKLSAEKGVH